MATHVWTQAPALPRTSLSPKSEIEPLRMEKSEIEPRRMEGSQSWVETYRAALVEVDPEARLERIFEADSFLRSNTRPSLDPRERDAIDEAREVLNLLREGIESRVSRTSWLL
jgi:hypothetical protein